MNNDFSINISRQNSKEILPTYMKNALTLMQIKEKLNKVSWDTEGAEVN
jgi:hypothetical protein